MAIDFVVLGSAIECKNTAIVSWLSYIIIIIGITFTYVVATRDTKQK